MRELPERFSVADLHVNLGLQQVTRRKTPIPLPKLSFDLLVALARSAPNLMSVDELMTRVWPGLVVNPETVSKRVELLRDALGDDPRAPTYIQGLRGRGYRLMPEVLAEQDPSAGSPDTTELPPASPLAASDAAPKSSPTVTTTARPRAWRNWAALALAVVAIASLISLLVAKIRQPQRPTRASSPAPRTPLASVAVMPFDDLSVNHDGGQLSLALPEMVLQRLGMDRELIVIARSSSFSFLGKQVDAREIGRLLNARYLVEGTLQRQGDELRVTAQLIDAATGRELQNLRFDRQLTNIFDLQDDIAGQLAAALQVQLFSADKKRVDRAKSSSLDAYLGYLHSQALLNRWTVADAESATQELEAAVRLDPSFALGYAELARARWIRSYLRDGRDNVADASEIIALADHALQLDPALGEAYAMRGQVRQLSDPIAAESDFRKGIELAPNYGPAYEAYAEALRDYLGRPGEAFDMIERAILIDPLTPRNIYIKGLYQWWDLNNRALAEQTFMHAIEVGPNFPPAYARLAELHWEQGNVAQAIQLIERALRLETQSHLINDEACGMYLDIGDRQAAQSVAENAPQDAIMKIMIAAFDGKYQEVAPERSDYVFSFRQSEEAYWLTWLRIASRVGNRDAAITTLRGDLAFKGDGASFDLGQNFDWHKVVALAYLLKIHDQREASANLLSDMRKFLDSQHNVPPHAYARIQFLTGDRDGAFANLAQELRPSHWNDWWLFDRQPFSDEVRTDPRYVALAKLESGRMAEQRAMLERMREAGEIPRR
jgi:TolB-like protein/DNA-binding winged helix-turn-helix (wHTH) protein/Tfp pilus assembly protein PilF